MIRPRLRVIQVRRPISLVAGELVAVQICLSRGVPFKKRLPVRIEFASIDDIPARVGQFPPAPKMIGVNPVETSIIALLRKRLPDRKSTRLNSSHLGISYAVFCLKKKNQFHDVRQIK